MKHKIEFSFAANEHGAAIHQIKIAPEIATCTVTSIQFGKKPDTLFVVGPFRGCEYVFPYTLGIYDGQTITIEFETE